MCILFILTYLFILEHVKNKRIFPCLYCNKQYYKLTILNYHVLNKHNSKCEMCDKTFMNEKSLQKHIKGKSYCQNYQQQDFNNTIKYHTGIKSPRNSAIYVINRSTMSSYIKKQNIQRNINATCAISNA